MVIRNFRLTEELKSESSRVLFLLSSTNDPSVPGYSPNGPGDDAAAQDGGPQQVRINFIFLFMCHILSEVENGGPQ